MKARVRAILDRVKRDDSETPVIRLPTKCTICLLPMRRLRAIDATLAAGTESFGAMAKRLGLSKATLHRHAVQHVLPKVKRELVTTGKVTEEEAATVETPSGLRELTAKGQIVPLYNRMERALKKAEDSGDWMPMKAFGSEMRQLLELSGRLNGEFAENAHPAGGNIYLAVVLPRGVTPGANNAVEAIDVKVIEATAAGEPIEN